MVNIKLKYNFVKTPRKFIVANIFYSHWLRSDLYQRGVSTTLYFNFWAVFLIYIVCLTLGWTDLPNRLLPKRTRKTLPLTDVNVKAALSPQLLQDQRPDQCYRHIYLISKQIKTGFFKWFHVVSMDSNKICLYLWCIILFGRCHIDDCRA